MLLALLPPSSQEGGVRRSREGQLPLGQETELPLALSRGVVGDRARGGGGALLGVCGLGGVLEGAGGSGRGRACVSEGTREV